MKLLVQLSHQEMLEACAKKQVGIVVGLDYYSSHGLVNYTVEQLQALEYPNEVFVLVNRLYEQKEIEGLRDTLTKLNDTAITGIIFQDFAVLSICNDLKVKFKLFYNSETLNTNHASINTLGTLGVSGCVVASQLHIEEVKSIVENSQIDLMIQIHGVQYISHSKRKLLSNYFEYNHIDHPNDYDSHIVMKVNNTDIYSHIYEDAFGTYVYSQNELCIKDYLKELDFKYGYIETMYLEDDYILELIDFYRSDLSYNDLVNRYSEHHYDTGFFGDGTVYKLEDVRKRENDEKR